MENTGILYVVATPIGNSKDLSPRAIDILSSVDVIAAEDTRRSIVLLNLLDIKNKLDSNHKFNEKGKAKYFIRLLQEGKNIAVISDAGTPCISDPGNELIKAAVDEGIKVVGIPGCCALTTALSVSGFDLSTFEFIGFLPRENNDRAKLMDKLRRNNTAKTFVFYESPLRISDAVQFFIDYDVQCSICVCNDISKLHEYIIRGTPSEVKDSLYQKFGDEPKGEYAVVFELAEEYRLLEKEHVFSPEAVLVEKMSSEDCSVKEAIELLLKDETNTYSKNELKKASLRLKKLFGDGD